MMASTRRAFLAALIGAGAIGGFCGPLAPLHAAPNPLSRLPLRFPDSPLRLERRLERGIGDDAVIMVRRSWDVRCSRQGRGIMVTGAQTDAEVMAPPHLSALALIEQQRDTSAMFPLMLDEAGMILSPGALPGESDAVADALRAAEAMIARQPVPADERERYRVYLAQVHQAGASLLDTLPPDLLFPTGVPEDRSETVALPDGLTGQFTLRYYAEPQADAPWLKRAERRVMTAVSGFTRSASEVWTLSPL